jgi:pimeloyl-ACP methyl ester carboxylesterase
LALWRRAPSLVRGLVLADTKAGADNAAGKEKRNEQIAMANARGSAAIADALVPVMVGKTTREQRPEVAETVRSMLARAPVSGIVGALTAMRDRPDSSATLATINVPTLIVAGEEDVLTPPSDARAVHEAIAGSRIEIIAGAGHLSNLERPAAFNHVLSEFFVSLAYM